MTAWRHQRFGFAWASIALLAGCGSVNDSTTPLPQIRPVTLGWLSSGFGPRPVHPVYGFTAHGHHDGYDFAVPVGSPIRASMAGKVTFTGVKAGYGRTVVLNHPGGYQTLYAHASRFAVRVGQSVEAGTVIAQSGNTGVSTGPHLHYELRHLGRPISPGLFVAPPDLAIKKVLVASPEPPRLSSGKGKRAGSAPRLPGQESKAMVAAVTVRHPRVKRDKNNPSRMSL